MKKTSRSAVIGAALLLAGCVAPPDHPSHVPPPAAQPAPAAVELVQPYLQAHTGHYFRGPYYR